MAPKLKIREFCYRCGERQARLSDDGKHVLYLHDDCEYAPPGPPDGPRRWTLNQVQWLPGTGKPKALDGGEDAE